MFNSNIMDYLKENYSSLADKLENNYDASETIISYDSYMRTEENIADKRDRLLAVDNKVYVPVEANVRVLVTAADVLHC
jgi:heme/copper-type cytochrome/quinol oxidase subunit 2